MSPSLYAAVTQCPRSQASPLLQPFLAQTPFLPHDTALSIGGHPAHVPRVDYSAFNSQQSIDAEYYLRYDNEIEAFGGEDDDESLKPPVKGMELVKLHVSGEKKDRVNLMFLADGCESSGRHSDCRIC